MSQGLPSSSVPPPPKAKLVAPAWPKLVHVARRGPILRPSPTTPGVYGLDLTAGCAHGCAYCHIRGAAPYPGEDRALFDPFTSEKLAAWLEELDVPPRRVVLSPLSDPLPPWRSVRAETARVIDVLLRRGVQVSVMTRGRVPRSLVELLARHADLASVAIGLTTMDRALSRALEPRAASPGGRVRDLDRLVRAGVAVEARLEPLIPELTDTRANLLPVFRALSRAGLNRVVAHHLFLHPSMRESLDRALAPLGWSEKIQDAFEEGPVFHLGSVGTTKHLPRETRRLSLARLQAWGAEIGLRVDTGPTQNPDLARAFPPPRPALPTSSQLEPVTALQSAIPGHAPQ